MGDLAEAASKLLDAKAREKLARAMIEPIRKSMDMGSVLRKAFKVEPLCQSCNKIVEEGAASGCPECVARSVMES